MTGDYLPNNIFEQIKSDLKARIELDKEIQEAERRLRQLRDKKKKFYTLPQIAKGYAVSLSLICKINYEIVINE